MIAVKTKQDKDFLKNIKNHILHLNADTIKQFLEQLKK